MVRLETMRSEIAKVYDNFTWRQRVAKMPANQVVAIYRSFEESGRLLPKKKPEYKQITIEEYISERS